MHVVCTCTCTCAVHAWGMEGVVGGRASYTGDFHGTCPQLIYITSVAYINYRPALLRVTDARRERDGLYY